MSASLIGRLSWDAADSDRRIAIEAAVATPDEVDLAALILPPGRKDAFEGSAEVLTRIGRPRLDPHIPALLAWLQDLNWPGARIVFDWLHRVDHAALRGPLAAALSQARAERDDDWAEALERLAQGNIEGSGRSPD